MHTPKEPEESAQTGTPKWLTKLQQESWQAEILISGGALLGLFSLADAVPTLSYVLDHGTTLDVDLVNQLRILSGFVVLLLLEGFLIHLIIRGYWIGLVGLNYVFPQGIRTDKLEFKGRFERLFKQTSNTDYLIKLDKLGSVIFAFTFLAIFSIISIVSFTLILFMVGSLFEGVDWGLGVTMLIFLLMGIFSLLDFFTLGRLKRRRWFATIYYPIYLVLSVITLSFLYRRLYYTIISNIRPMYVTLLVFLPFATIVTVLIGLKGDQGLLSQNFVSLESRSNRSFLHIPNPIVRDSLLQFTVSHFPRLEEEIVDSLKKASLPVSLDSLGSVESAYLAASRYRIFIDDVEVKTAHWLPQYNYETSFLFSRVLRFTVAVSTENLKSGTHELGVRIDSRTTDYRPTSGGFFARTMFIIP